MSVKKNLNRLEGQMFFVQKLVRKDVGQGKTDMYLPKNGRPIWRKKDF